MLSLSKFLKDKLIEVIQHLGVDLNLPTIGLFGTFDVSLLTALDASVNSHFVLIRSIPFLQAPVLFMANMVTF